MAGTLSVQKIQGLASSATPTTVEVSSGHKLYAPGHVIQVQSSILTTAVTFSNTSFADVSGLTVNITPSSSSSKVLVTAHLGGVSGAAAHAQMFGFARDSTVIGQTTASVTNAAGFGMYNGNDNQSFGPMSFQMLDSPNTTSQVTYKVQSKTTGSSFYLNRWGADTGTFGFSSSITVMEIAQ